MSGRSVYRVAIWVNGKRMVSPISYDTPDKAISEKEWWLSQGATVSVEEIKVAA